MEPSSPRSRGHQGHVLRIRKAVGSCVGNDLFYWPPGHSARVVQDAEVILFSPQVEHSEVMDHMIATMAG